MAAGKIHASDSRNACGVSGEPLILPRVGDEYQVDIPPYTQIWTDGDNSWDSYVGLHIPLRWANQGRRTNKRLDSILDDGKLENMSIDEKQPKGECPDSCLVPDGDVDPLTNIEKKTFLLGLYVFEKNFAHLKRFLQTKRTCDIMSYYYGEFYRSDEYRRWSDGRKVKSRKCVYGQKLFIGSRLQELLSRLLPNMSADRRNELSEISRRFGEGKVRLEEYVFTLKCMVGINTLIEAVGIGKGKQDLTNVALEHTRSSHALTMRSEVPTGKACSSLTPTEIIKYLTGGHRLSKTRSNDLFWEAVWPRLLARGWHSEQPKNTAYAASSKQGLVFLMPDVKKFSRKFIKGTHYFDSVTDVLAKVASEPKLLDLDSEDQDGNENQGGKVHGVAKVDTDDLSIIRSHSYLQPRTPNQSDDMKFTVVDTSLCNSKPYKVRDFRSLPLEVSKKLCLQSNFGDTSKDNNKVSTGPDSINPISLDQSEPIRFGSNTSLHSGETSPGRIDLEIGTKNLKISHFRSQEVHGSNVLNNEDLSDDAKSIEVVEVKPCISHRVRKDYVNNIVPVSKRSRRLSACNRTATRNIGCVSRGEVAMSSCSSSMNTMPANNALQMGSLHDKISTTISSKSSPSMNIERVPVNSSSFAEVSPAEHQPRILIDLNVLPVSSDSENGLSVIDITEDQTDSLNKPESHFEQKVLSSVNTSSDQQHPGRRHSTRTRPPTTRVLEAFANGFLTVNKRQKNKEVIGSQQDHGKTKTVGLGNNSQVSKMEEEKDHVCNKERNDVFGKFKPPPNGNGGSITGL
ncbi:unnamed protein product [Cuscuta epithymum]|uniref:SANT domain-containing protein n=1 Tax=Cuscuta epithymum TaxID=186058 RepID=A0AAV0D599_9ASTE|nr:unnamed protein product [Cuscuta epithymum]